MRVPVKYEIERNVLKVSQAQREYHQAQAKNYVALMLVISAGVLLFGAVILTSGLGSF